MEEKKEQQSITDQVVEALRSCYDPEIPVNIYELGLIYDVAIDASNNVNIKMTLTSPACPAAGTLPAEVEARVGNISQTKQVKVDVVWEPTWTPEMMSDVARYELGMM